MTITKPRILFLYDFYTSFVKKDIDSLSKNFDVDVYHFKFKRKTGVLKAYFFQFFYLLLTGNKYDLYITQFAGHVSLFPSVFSKFFKTKSLILVAGTDAASLPDIKYGNKQRFFQKIATSMSFRFCDFISPCHESLVEQEYTYDEMGAPKQGYHVFYKSSRNKHHLSIPYGFNGDFFKRNHDVERKKMSFLTIGNLSVKTLFLRKGYDLIIELGRRVPNLSITLVGAPKNYLLPNLPENIKLLPYLNHEELINVFSEHQFYFQLSLMEGFPNALCEAMLCECIPIGSNVSGIPEIINNTGFILKKRKIEDLQKIIDSIPNDSFALESLGQKSRQRILDNYSLTTREHLLSKLIHELISYQKT